MAPSPSRALLAGLVLLAAAPMASAQETKRPNILFVIADDQSPFDLKVYEPASRLETPVLDRLAAKGMTFDGAYHMGSWSGAVCTPSRHMVMSGRSVWHLPRNGIRGVDANPLCPEDLPASTLAAVFNDAGYDTMRTCKKGNSYEAANEQFTVRRDATKRGASDEDGSAWHAEQVLAYLSEREASGRRGPLPDLLRLQRIPTTRAGPSEELLEKYGADNDVVPDDRARRRAAPAGQLPAHRTPSTTGTRACATRSTCRASRSAATSRRSATRSAASSPAARTSTSRSGACSTSSRRWASSRTPTSSTRPTTAWRSDATVSRASRTSTSTPGACRSSSRVPGIAAGSRAQGNVYLMDVLGTLCDLAEIEVPATFEGSQLPAGARGKSGTPSATCCIGVYCGGTKPGMRSVRKRDWKLIKYDVLDEGTFARPSSSIWPRTPRELLIEHHDEAVVELTGHRPEPHQVNLAGDPRHAEKLAEMEALLLSEMKRLDDPYRLWDQPQD